jgi:RNA polymerase sigma factor (sigma-70 family)
MDLLTLDHDLLAEFKHGGNAAAMDQLVRRHVDSVYAAAKRQVHDPHLAEDITQAVFIMLFRKAKTIRSDVKLTRWLFAATRYAVANARRAESRRKTHERAAAAERPDAIEPIHVDAEDRAKTLALLDEAIADLRPHDRDLVLMRYWQGRNLASAGAALGISHDSARQRLSRAVDRMRKFFSARGVTLGAAAALVILETSAEKAPAAVVGAISRATLQATPSALAIAKGTQMMMFWTKIKFAAAMISLLSFVGITVGVVHSVMAQTAVAPPAQSAPVAAGLPANDSHIVASITGIDVELLGVSQNPSKGKKWWKPDGSPLNVAPYDDLQWTSMPSKGQHSYEFAVSIGGTPLDMIEWKWVINSGDFTYGGKPIDSAQKPVDGVIGACHAIDSAAGETSLRLYVASGIWTPKLVCDPSGGASFWDDAGHEAIVGQPAATDGGLTIVTSDSMVDQSARLVANLPGKEVRTATVSFTVTAHLRMITSTFPGLSIKDVKTFEFQTRPYNQWVQFDNVSLKPGEKKDVQVLTSN